MHSLSSLEDLEKLNPEQLAKYYSVLADPIQWAEIILNCELREFQKDILRGYKRRNIVRVARRAGKCLSANAKIVNAETGELIAIKDVVANKKGSVFSVTDNYKLIKQKPEEFIYSGKKEVYKVLLNSGKEIEITENHPLLTMKGWVPLKDLKINDSIAEVNLSYSGIIFEKIKSIEYAGIEDTYDLSFNTNHNFIANDIVVHNSYGIGILLLWWAFTHKEAAMRIVTPLERHLEPYFKESFRKFINESKIIADSIASNQSRPYEIAFKNGSRITGYTSGAKTGGKGLSVRGQRCDILVVDEASYMNDDAIDAAMALTMEHPDVIVFMSSTPSGARNKFWLFSTDKSLGWKEFHYPAANAIPGWDEARDREARLNMTNEGYITEVLAEHGSDIGGVFPKKHMDLCMQKYDYVELDHDEDGIKLLGVDWDKHAAGCHMIVLKYFPQQERFRIINHSVVPKSEYTLSNAVEKVVDLNSKFDPAYIYVDQGFGELNIELLHKYGINNPASELHRKLKGIAFNNVLEIIDPANGTVSKKVVKHWSINNLTILIESGIIDFNSEDLILKREMEAYRVDSQSVSGPIYTKTNDHAIAALLLAVLAYVQEISPISKPVLNAAKPTFTSMDTVFKDQGERTLNVNQMTHKEKKFVWDDPEYVERGSRIFPKRKKNIQPHFNREI